MVDKVNKIDKKDIFNCLNMAGVRQGELIHVHSSLSSFGYIDGGAMTVIEALCETVGADGTVCMPSMFRRDGDSRFETWNVKTSPSDVGKITDLFWRLEGTHRSDHPTHSVAACGKLAQYITQGHRTGEQRIGPWGGYAFGYNSPWQKLYDLNAKIILLGTNMKTSSTVHYIEHLIVEYALGRSELVQCEKLSERVLDWLKNSEDRVWPSYDRLKLQEEMERRGMIDKTTCGESKILIYHAKNMVNLALKLMKKEPDKWFNDNFLNWYKTCLKLA